MEREGGGAIIGIEMRGLVMGFAEFIFP